jgi:hypothetical protein
MWIGILVIAAAMVKVMLDENIDREAIKKLMFLTLIMLFWVHLFGPRGCFKYYYTFMVPLFSIFATSGMIKGKDIKVTNEMKINPILIGFVILLPAIPIYLLYVVILLLIYVDHENIGRHYMEIKNKLYDIEIYLRAKWNMFTERERTMTKIMAFLVMLSIVCSIGYYNSGYYNGFNDGYIEGDKDAQRGVFLSFGDIVDIKAYRNVTVWKEGTTPIWGSFLEFHNNFTFCAGVYYLGTHVCINISLYLNASSPTEAEIEVWFYREYVVGSGGYEEFFMFIGSDWISLAKFSITEEDLL